MKSRFKLFVVCLLLVISRTNATSEKEKQCPTYCTCDIFENTNRADCSGQQIISPNVDVPAGVEFLDLSYNDISTLDNDCFQGLVHLKVLTVAYNALHTIYLDAFSPLSELKSISLSNNRLEYFDERIFEVNSKLTRLDLSGNKFTTLQNKPFLRSKSLRFLNLHDAQITYIYPLMFAQTPALIEIDISGNLMITLTATPFSGLKQLEVVDLQENRWNCDRLFESTLETLKKRDVEVRVEPCASSASEDQKSERMVELPSVSSAREPTSIESIWRPNKEPTADRRNLCSDTKPEKLCQLYRGCLVKLLAVSQQRDAKQFFCRGKYVQEDIYFAFAVGIGVGTLSIGCLISIAFCSARLCKRNKTRPARCTSTYEPFIASPPPRRPPPVRPSRNPSRRSRAPAPPTEIRVAAQGGGENNDFASFISKLFERPSRHQLRRSMHEGRAYMIRRLSQSNLFNNRNSAAPRAEPSSAEQGTSSQAGRSAEERWQSAAAQALRSSSATSSAAPPKRPETPPPSYDDVRSNPA